MNIVRKFLKLLGFLFLFVNISFVSFAGGGLDYSSSDALLNNASRFRYSGGGEEMASENAVDNDLNTCWLYGGEVVAKHSFGREYMINSYFVKGEGLKAVKLFCGGVKVPYSVSSSYSQDGGIYYVFSNPVKVDTFTLDLYYAKIYELDFFSSPLLTIREDTMTNDSIGISYSLSNAKAINYDIYVDGKKIDTTSFDSYKITGLKAYTLYSIKVKAKISDDNYVEATKQIRTKSRKLELIRSDRKDKLNKNDTITYIFNNDIKSVHINTDKNIVSSSKTIDKSVILTINNDFGQEVSIDYVVTDIYGNNLTVKKQYITIKKGGILMTFDFSFISDWTDALVPTLKTSSIAVIVSVLGLAGVIIGGFFLIGLVKKAVGKAK